MRLSSYSKVHTVGHKEVQSILDGEVIIEEKIDGSQFTMARVNGELLCRSKGKEIVLAAPEKMFIDACSVAACLPLRDGWVYRCEYLNKPKHNTLAYSRIPTRYLMLFDVMIAPETYLGPQEKLEEAKRLGIECVPCYYSGVIGLVQFLNEYLDKESVLGGVKIEGVVIKNYSKFTPDGKLMTAKLVSDSFKEKHRISWRADNPTPKDVLERFIFELRSEARWNKAIQHLRETGLITDTPADIGPLIKEIQNDVQQEETGYIMEKLFEHFWPQIQRGVIRGFPEFYKKRLVELFEGPTVGELRPPADMVSILVEN